MLKSFSYSLATHFCLLALIYFSSSNLHYYDLDISSKKKSSSIKLNIIHTEKPEDKKGTSLAVATNSIETRTKLKGTASETPEQKNTQEQKKEPADSEAKVQTVKTKNNKTSEVMDSFVYVKKPEFVGQEKIITKSNEEEYGEQEGIKISEIQNEEEENFISLTLRERMNLKRQIKSCYKMAIINNGFSSSAKVKINISLMRSGHINIEGMELVDTKTYESEEEKIDFDMAVKNIKKALSFCNPLRNLPKNKYAIWNRVSIEFDSGNI